MKDATLKKSIFVAILAVAFLSGCRERRNSLRQMGFPVENASVVTDYTPTNLKGEQKFVKANLTSAQAKTLRKSFKALPASRAFDSIVTPKQIPALTGDASWTPQKVEKYWSGSFEKKELTSIFHCKSVFDTSNPKKIVLYFYAITFDD